MRIRTQYACDSGGRRRFSDAEKEGASRRRRSESQARDRRDTHHAWALAHKLHQPTIRRIVIGETSPTEQMIEKIARSMGLDPWQLLVPGMTVRNAPVLRELTDIERQLYERIDETIAELGKLREMANTGPGPL
jgi:transcriptional regulator with XRE-family HTH domain